MPSRSATSRASWMSRPAQQAPLRPVAVPWSYSCSVTPITSCPASASSPATTLLSTPPDIAATMRIGLSELGVAGGGREPDDEPVQRRRHHDLAAEAAGGLEPEGEVQHVLFVLGRLGQLGEPGRVDDDMAGRAGQRALAGALDVDPVLVRDLQHREAVGRVDLARLAV